MFGREIDNPEVRETINETLRDVLSTGGWTRSQWDALLKYLDKEFGIKTDLLELALNAPGLVHMFQIGALARKGIIGKRAQETLSQIIRALVSIAYHAESGDEEASNQLQVLHKIAYPSGYELPATVIKGLADSYHTSPHLVRGWAIRSLMLELSYVVEPTRLDRSVLDGAVRMVQRNKLSFERGLYEKASKFIRTGSTLQSLAITIYIDNLEKEGITIDPREIKRDLQKLKEWEALNLKNPPYNLPLWDRAGEYPPASIPPIPIHSEEGWKRQWRRGGKKDK